MCILFLKFLPDIRGRGAKYEVKLQGSSVFCISKGKTWSSWLHYDSSTWEKEMGKTISGEEHSSCWRIFCKEKSSWLFNCLKEHSLFLQPHKKKFFFSIFGQKCKATRKHLESLRVSYTFHFVFIFVPEYNFLHQAVLHWIKKKKKVVVVFCWFFQTLMRSKWVFFLHYLSPFHIIYP